MKMKFVGKVHKYGGNINTDEIIPACYLNTSDPKELGKHCLEGLDKEFVKKLKPGDIIVAGKNFGCGSSREHAAVALRSAKVSCIIAKSFARIFFRNAINTGLPIVELKKVNEISSGDKIEVDLKRGLVKNFTKNKIYSTIPFPDFLQDIIKSGGLMKFLGSLCDNR